MFKCLDTVCEMQRKFPTQVGLKLGANCLSDFSHRLEVMNDHLPHFVARIQVNNHLFVNTRLADDHPIQISDDAHNHELQSTMANNHGKCAKHNTCNTHVKGLGK